jgi:hypothetical protein
MCLNNYEHRDCEEIMQYQDNEYGTETDAAPWTAAPAPAPAQLVSSPRNGQMLAAQPRSPVVVQAPQSSNVSEVLVLGSLIQSVQSAQSQQMYLLRDMNARLARLEDSARQAAVENPGQTSSVERATWWALWGVLMLILGGALAIVTLLILLNIQFR